MLDASYTQRPYSSGLFGAAPAAPRNPMMGLLDPDKRQSIGNALLGTPAVRVDYLEPWATANFGNELQKPFWTIDDGVPILLGINPVFAGPTTLAQHEFADSTAFEGMRLRRLVAAAQLMADLPIRFRPHEFINWALAQDIPVPESLLKLAASRGRPIKGYPNPIEVLQGKHRELVEKARAALAMRDARIADLEARVQSLTAEAIDLKRERDDIEARTAAAIELAEQAKASTSNSGNTRNYNTTAKLLYGLAKADHGVDFGGMAKVRTKSVLASLQKAEISVDDETLLNHLLHGSQEAARRSNSPK